MTRKDQLTAEANKYPDLAGKQIKLYIHMPNGETETIINPDVSKKVCYILGAYDDNLYLSTNNKIFIIDYEISDITPVYKINWKQKLSSRKFWVTIGGFITALLVVFGVKDITIEQIIGVIGACGTLAVYVLGESKTDANRTGGEK